MIKDEYKDIPDEEFVPLTCVDECFLGIFEINKLGRVRNGKTLNIFSGVINTAGYRQVTLQVDKIKHTYTIHRLVAKTFLKDPGEESNKYMVDHINRVRSDNSVYNLRWATPLENSINRDRTFSSVNWYKVYDETWNLIKEVPVTDYSAEERKEIQKHPSRLYKGYYWRKFNKELEDRLKELDKTIDDLVFIEYPRNPRVLVSKEGIIKLNKHYTLGSTNGGGYKTISLSKEKRTLVHRIVFETFSGIHLEDSDIIDHIDTIRDNNSFENLRLCKSHAENKRNIKSRENSGRSVNQYSLDGTFLKTFPSMSIASEETGSNHKIISQVCNGDKKTHNGYTWKYADLDPNTPEYHGKTPKKFYRGRITRLINQYNSDGTTLIDTFSSLKEASDKTGVYVTSIGKCCSGKQHKAGGYIWKYADTDPNTPEHHKS